MSSTWDNIIIPTAGCILSITLNVGKTISIEGAVASLIYGGLGALGAVIINRIIKYFTKKRKMKKYQIDSAVESQVLAYAAAIEINPEDSVTTYTAALTGNATINVGATAKPTIGDRVILKATSDGTARNVTFGTGITAPVLAGVINKTKVQELVYDGAGFVAASAPVQID